MNQADTNPQDDKPRYQLDISFESDERNAQALWQALAQICDAWARHHRIREHSCELRRRS